MAFEKGHIKAGGRKKGTPNKRSTELADKLAALNCDPITAMAKIAMDETVELRIRAQLFKELAAYCYPKRKAVEHTGDAFEQVVISFADPNSL